MKSIRIRSFYKVNWQSKSPYSVRIRENTGQKNFEYRHFLHSDINHATELSAACHASSEWRQKVTVDFTEIINEPKPRHRTVSHDNSEIFSHFFSVITPTIFNAFSQLGHTQCIKRLL